MMVINRIAFSVVHRTCILFVALLIWSSCTNKNPKEIKIPDGFELQTPDKDRGEILYVKYKNEMQISVSTNASDIIKKSMFYGPRLMKQTFDLRFPILLKKHKGNDLQDFNHYFVNGNMYMNQSFEYNTGSSVGYYEYGALYIEKPESYYEFYISGSKEFRDAHRVVINSLLEGF